MKKIINGRMYNTETAKLVGFYRSSGIAINDFKYFEETLYRKKTGEFFLRGEGGPASRYTKSIGNNSWTGDIKIIPLSLDSAKKWAEKHLEVDEYEKIFGSVQE